MELYEIEIMVTNYNFVCGFTPIKYLHILDYTLENMRLEPILNTIELELLYKTKKSPYNIRIETRRRDNGFVFCFSCNALAKNKETIALISDFSKKFMELLDTNNNHICKDCLHQTNYMLDSKCKKTYLKQ